MASVPQTCPQCNTPLPPGVGDRPGSCSVCGWPGAPPASAAEDPGRTGPYVLPSVRDGPDISGYEILSELGRGGMGVVYLARQTKLKRLVALKMILAGVHAGAEERARFRAEAEVVARLRHPNLVQVYDTGECPGGAYLALEYVDGGTLADRLAGAPLPPRQAAWLVAVLADAVQAAHEQGIIHRDLKPANVLLSRAAAGAGAAATTVAPGRGSGGTNPASGSATRPPSDDGAGLGVPKVSDFGLARRLGEETGLTGAGPIPGTPSYMAPEQAEGRHQVIGPAADVYGLGAILYECLTGRPPFRGASIPETLEQVRSNDPVPPSRLQPRMPRDLETICLKCLHKDPARRYPTPRELADDLGRFQAGEPIRARPVGRAERLAKWARRRPAVAFLLALIAAVVLGSAATVFALLRQEQNLRNEALANSAKAKDRAEAAKEKAAAAAGLSREAAVARGQARDRLAGARVNAYLSRLAQAERDLEANQAAAAEDTLDACPTDLCGWEWRYLKHLCGRQSLSLPGRDAVAFRPDGRQLAAAVAPGTPAPEPAVNLWDILEPDAPGSQRRVAFVRRLLVPSNVTSLAWSSDGRRLAATCVSERLSPSYFASEIRRQRVLAMSRVLASAATGAWATIAAACLSPHERSLRGALLVWDAASGREVYRLEEMSELLLAVAFSPDGRWLAASDSAGLVTIRSAAGDRVIRTFRCHPRHTVALAWSLDSRRLACAESSRAGRTAPVSPDVVRIWEVASGRELAVYRGHQRDIRSVAFSPDGRHIASAGQDAAVHVWDAATGTAIRQHTGYVGFIAAVAWDPQGRWLAAAGEDQGVHLWPTTGTAAPLVLSGHRAGVAGLAFSRDDRLLASADSKSEVKVWDLNRLEEPRARRGHLRAVTAVAFSRDGRLGASADSSGALKVWDPAGAGEPRTLAGHKAAIHALAFGRGSQLASAGDDGVRLWDAATGSPGRVLASFAAWGVAFSPDSRRIAVGTADGALQVFDGANGRAVSLLRGHGARVRCVAFSPDGRLLAAGSRYIRPWDQRPLGQVRVWEVAGGKLVHSLLGGSGEVRGLAWAADKRRLAAASGDDEGGESEVKVWDAVDGQPLLTLRGDAFPFAGVVFGPAGRLVTAGRHLKLWDEQTGAEVLTLPGSAARLSGVACRSDGLCLAAGGSDGAVHLWQLPAGPVSRALRGHDGPVVALAFRKEDKRLTSATTGNVLCVWDPEEGQRLKEVATIVARRRLALAPDGHIAAMNARRRFVDVYGIPSGRVLFRLPGEAGNLQELAFSADGRRLAAAGTDGTLWLWDVAGRRQLLRRPGLARAVGRLALSPDGSLLAAAESGRLLVLWDTADGLQRRLPGVQGGRITALVFSPDGRRLASAEEDGTVTVRDVVTGMKQRTLRYLGGIAHVAFSLDGKRLAGAGADGKALVWDLATGGESSLQSDRTGAVLCVAFTPDGRQLAAGGDDRIIRLWNLGEDGLLPAPRRP